MGSPSLPLLYADKENPLVFPTFDEMNDEMFDWYEGEKEQVMDFEEHYTNVEILAAAVKPPSPVRQIPSPPELISLLTGSRDCLFFLLPLIFQAAKSRNGNLCV